MQQGNPLSTSDPGTKQPGCAFCQRETLSPYILKETDLLRVVADHAPLVAGHILIVPRKHYTCYGDVPDSYDAKLKRLKDEVKRFFERYYQPIVYWEHGIFHQTVFHAHLHCFPFGDITYDPAEGIHECLIESQEEIRAWHAAHGHYFYLEDRENAALFAAREDHYTRIIREVLGPGTMAQNQSRQWRSARQRMEEGKPLIDTVMANWQEFQQQEEK